MPALQTLYPEYMARAVEGMKANMEYVDGNIVSRLVETSAGIGFGKVACRGTGDNQIKVAAAGAKFLGITVLDATQEQDSYPRYATAQVMTQGCIWVKASVAVAAGDPAYFVPATGALTNAASGNTAIPNGVFDTSTTGADQLARLRLA